MSDIPEDVKTVMRALPVYITPIDVARAILAERKRCIDACRDLSGHGFYHIRDESKGDDGMVLDDALAAVIERIESGQ